MELGEALRRRRMVRRHTGEAVPADALDRVVAAGLSAPSAGHSQGVSVIVISRAADIAAIADAAGEPDYLARGFDPWVSTAGALLVLCVEPEVYRRRYEEPDKDPSTLEVVPWWWVDAGAALMAMLLAATDAGMGAGFLGAHAIHGVEEHLAIPPDVQLVGLVTLGPPAQDRRSGSLDRGRREGRRHDHRW